MKRAYTFLFLLGASSVGCAQNYICPEKIYLTKDAIAAASIPAGSQPNISSAPVRLTGVSTYDGPPSEGALLKPTNEDRRNSTIVWNFSREVSSNVWLACDYADQLMQVTVKIDGSPSTCVATARKEGIPKILRAQFECK